MTGPKLKYVQVAWHPYEKEHVKKSERLSKIDTRIVSELENLQGKSNRNSTDNTCKGRERRHKD